MSTAPSIADPTPPLAEREVPGARIRTLPSWPARPLQRIHGAVVPADVRAGDPISAQLRISGGAGRATAAQVWRISPLGVELVRPGASPALGAGAHVDLTLRVGESAALFRALAVVSAGEDRGRPLLGLTWAEAGPPPMTVRREAARFACRREYLPTGIARSAARYGDFVYFRVVDVSATGMQLETSLRNKYVVPGVTFDAACTFPAQARAQVQLRLQVVHARVVHREGREVLALGVRHAAPPRGRAREVIGQYLLQFGAGATVQGLAAEGFAVPATSLAFDFGAVRTPEEYGDVLRLRRLAYVHARKLSDETKDVDMADDFDARSRILVARHHGRAVGTVRLMFPATARDPLKHEDFLPIPPGLPPREQTVEVSKACTHPGHRGSDLFYVLLKHTALTILQSGRRHALMSATDALAPVYARCGFRHTGASYVHPSMGVRHHLMIADMHAVVSGKGLSPLLWNLLDLGELWEYARRCGVVAADPLAVARVRAYRLLRPIAALVRAAWRRRARRGH